MSSTRHEKRGRKVYIGPFDTFVKQLQNIATLFPGMSDAEQHQAVNILKQFTSVIAERFGSNDPVEEEDIKPVEIVPLSPDDVMAEDDFNQHDSSMTYTSEICRNTDTKGRNHDTVEYILDGTPSTSDINDSHYYTLAVIDEEGNEKLVLVNKEDVKLNEEGKIMLSKDEMKIILSEVAANNLSSPRMLNDSTAANSSEEQTDQTHTQDIVNDKNTVNVSSDGSQTSASACQMTDLMHDSVEQCQSRSPANKADKHNKLNSDCLDLSGGSIKSEIPSSATSTVAENKDEPEASENVPIKRRRGRPRGSKKGQKSKEKTICSVCGKQLNNKSNLTVHMRSHTGERPYKCQYCDDAFTTHGNLRRHKAAHLGEKKFACQVCGQAFLEKKSMIMHMRRHTGEKPYSCEFCGQRFRQISALRIHKARHTGIRNHTCSLCNKSFIQKGALLLHMKQHSEGKSISCPDCNRLFHSKEQLMKHRQRHDKGILFRCVLCSVTLGSQLGLLKHMTTFHGEGGEKKFVCKPCNREYSSKQELQGHVRSEDHMQVIHAMEDATSVSELFKTDVQLEEVPRGEVDELPTIKQEMVFETEMNQAMNNGGYTADKEDGTTTKVSPENLSQMVISNLTNIQSVILTDKGNRIYVLQDAPEKNAVE